MRTISTLCASGAGIAVSSIGLAIVREHAEDERSETSRNPSPGGPEMSAAVAAYPPSRANLSSPFPLSTPPSSGRTASEEILNGKARSSSAAKIGQKRALTPRASFSTGMDRPGEPDRRNGTPSDLATPDAQPRAWLRRFSSSLSTSRDTNSPISRPGSAAPSHSNGSVAFSHAGSTVPMLPTSTPPSLPNKLVKRTSSVRSINGSPSTYSSSRLPVPVFKRPATSHQRSATLQDMYASKTRGEQMSLESRSTDARDLKPVHYFTARARSDGFSFAPRRSSSGIPTPMKRVYPDRRYKPVLTVASKDILPARAEADDNLSEEDEATAVPRLTMSPSYASSPLPQTTDFALGPTPRRSFSIGDLLSTGPQPLWRRPSRTGGSGNKLIRRTRPRIASAPQSAMGASFSKTSQDIERPTKRRDLTDPAAYRRIYSFASSGQQAFTPAQEVELHLGSTSPQSLSLNADTHQESAVATDESPLEQRRLPSASLYSATVRPVRVSAAQSELISTVGSDSETESIGDASTDYQSDAFYDSYPTRTTRSSYGKRGPHIEMIFDESPPTFSSGRSTKLKDLLNDGIQPQDDHAIRYRHSTIEEEGSVMSTPVRTVDDRSAQNTPSARPGAVQQFTSSPPTMPDPDEMDWDAPDDVLPATNQFSRSGSSIVQRSVPFRFGPALDEQDPLPAQTPVRANGALSERANLFEWAEVQPSPGANTSPPRPRTVHGKKDQEGRGSRPSGRRAPSGMHARSHSVPVVPDTEGKRNNVIANKFGTWGVGSKAVTEDWNEDFDFDESPAPVAEQAQQDEKRIDSGHGMFVPKSIRQQQESVISNIRLLREWGLLIEELKELRIRAVALEIINGRYAYEWQEVDAMIELADQESEEQTLQPRQSPPSSPGFDYSAFDEPRPNIAEVTRTRGQSPGLAVMPIPEAAPLDNIDEDERPSTPAHRRMLRPRKDSEAVARSVIAAIQSKRSVSEPTGNKSTQEGKKVPFDTATLRHIVPYVKDLQRKVKDALRETEGLYSSPRRRAPRDLEGREDDEDEQPAFRSIFDGPYTPEVDANRQSRREQARTGHDVTETITSDQQADLVRQMEGMEFQDKSDDLQDL